jgi:hypothetical protein
MLASLARAKSQIEVASDLEAGTAVKTGAADERNLSEDSAFWRMSAGGCQDQ